MDRAVTEDSPNKMMPRGARWPLYLVIFAFPLLAAAANSVYTLVFLIPPALVINAVIFHAILKNRRESSFHLWLTVIGALLALGALSLDSDSDFQGPLLALVSWFLASSVCLQLRNQDQSRFSVYVLGVGVAAASVVGVVTIFMDFTAANLLFVKLATLGLVSFSAASLIHNRMGAVVWPHLVLSAFTLITVAASVNANHVLTGRDLSATRAASSEERRVFPSGARLAVTTDCVRILALATEVPPGIECEDPNFVGFNSRGEVVNRTFEQFVITDSSGTYIYRPGVNPRVAPSGTNLGLHDHKGSRVTRALPAGRSDGFVARHSGDYYFTVARLDPTERWIAVGDSTGRVLVRPNTENGEFLEVARMEGGAVTEFQWWVGSGH